MPWLYYFILLPAILLITSMAIASAHSKPGAGFVAVGAAVAVPAGVLTGLVAVVDGVAVFVAAGVVGFISG